MKRLRASLLALLLLAPLVLLAQSQDDQGRALLSEGIRLHDERNYEGAIAKYDEALELDISEGLYVAVVYEKAYSLSQMEKYKEALKLLEAYEDKTALIRDQIGEVYYGLIGTCYNRQGKTKQALAAYERGLEVFPDHPHLCFNMAVALIDADRPDDAIAALDRGLKTNLFHSNSNILRGALASDKDRKTDAAVGYTLGLMVGSNVNNGPSMLLNYKEMLRRNIQEEDGKYSVLIQTTGGSDDLLGGLTGTAASMVTDAAAIDGFEKHGHGQLNLPFFITFFESFAKELSHEDGGKFVELDRQAEFLVKLIEQAGAAPVAARMLAVCGEQDGLQWLEENEAEYEAFIQAFNALAEQYK